jgi:hypothetical protein
MGVKQTPDSFWARVKKSRGCWEWQGACNSTGYGNVAWAGKVYTAHRIAAWLSEMIDTPAAPKNRKGSGFVLHKCDNRRCCNPRHFVVGTYSANQQDAYSKKRKAQPRGEHHANAKLTKKQVQAIREAYANGHVQTKLAAMYGVSQRVISLIVQGKSYR